MEYGGRVLGFNTDDSQIFCEEKGNDDDEGKHHHDDGNGGIDADNEVEEYEDGGGNGNGNGTINDDEADKDEGVRGVGDYEVPVERRPPIHQLASKKRWMADEMEERGDDDDGDVDDGGGDVDDDDGGPDGERRDNDNVDYDVACHLFPICHHYQPFHCQFAIQKKLGNEREREKENRKERRERGLLGVCHLFPRVTRV